MLQQIIFSKVSIFFDVTLPDIGTTLTRRINDNFQKLYPAT